jgi:hypothetical protein
MSPTRASACAVRAIWLEIKSDNVEEMCRKIVESGLVRKLEVSDPVVTENSVPSENGEVPIIRDHGGYHDELSFRRSFRFGSLRRNARRRAGCSRGRRKGSVCDVSERMSLSGQSVQRARRSVCFVLLTLYMKSYRVPIDYR